MELWIGAVNLGFLYAFMAMGVFITFRLHHFSDITVDGSFTAGAAASAVLIISGFNPLLSLGAAFLLGAIAGSVTGIIHTKFKIDGLLAAILVMTGLYSINLRVMGRSNIPLLNQNTFLTYVAQINPGLLPDIWTVVVVGGLVSVFWIVSSLLLKTDFGIAMRITGGNPTMAAANGVNPHRMTVLGIALANGFVAVSGGLVAQYQGFADIGMGIGTIVVGLASVIIGESLFRRRSVFLTILSVILGSIIFRLMIACALYAGMNPIDLKLLTALFVLLTLIVSKSLSSGQSTRYAALKMLVRRTTGKKVLLLGTTAFVLIGMTLLSVRHFGHSPSPAPPSKKTLKIGFIQISDNGLLNITRDSFVNELKKLGYIDGRNCSLLLGNANGDLPTVNTILDKFLQQQVDIVVPISTACTQAAINKIKDRPVIFATVANPFIIGAATTETDHLPNVTGVYGWVPMNETLKIIHSVLPGKLKIGSVWDPAHANSVFNVDNLKKAVAADNEVEFVGATISGSSEVYQAAQSLVQKHIDAFVLSPDNIVYSAFESIVKAAATRNIPIFMSDVERLKDGALCTLGYDYSISGTQAAHLVDRVFKGEKPADIPLERYHKKTLGLNLTEAKKIGIDLPAALIKRATVVYDDSGISVPDMQPTASDSTPKRIALFIFSEHSMMLQAIQGIRDELHDSGVLETFNMSIDLKNAQNEYTMAQSIVQDIVRQKYDYLITLSTPALQISAQGNKTIPHIFGAVTDPFRMGIAKSRSDHIPNITGVATLQPVEATIRVMREIFPQARTIGMIWNTAEACSEACTLKGREAADRYGFKLIEANVGSTSEVMDALRSLLTRKIDLFMTAGDGTVLLALESIAQVLKQKQIPYFTNSPSDVEKGTFISIGADYYEVGRETSRVAVRVINGENPADIPINDCVPEKMAINLALADAYGITIPRDLLNKAGKVLKR